MHDDYFKFNWLNFSYDKILFTQAACVVLRSSDYRIFSIHPINYAIILNAKLFVRVCIILIFKNNYNLADIFRLMYYNL